MESLDSLCGRLAAEGKVEWFAWGINVETEYIGAVNDAVSVGARFDGD